MGDYVFHSEDYGAGWMAWSQLDVVTLDNCWYIQVDNAQDRWYVTTSPYEGPGRDLPPNWEMLNN
jgi:hypothetical protein